MKIVQKFLNVLINGYKHNGDSYIKHLKKVGFDEHFWLWRNAIDSSTPKRFLYQNSLIKGSESKT